MRFGEYIKKKNKNKYEKTTKLSAEAKVRRKQNRRKRQTIMSMCH